MNGNIIITGAAGWLGKRVLKGCMYGLDDYPEIQLNPSSLRILVRPDEQPFPEEKDVEKLVGDLTDEDDCQALLKGGAGGTLIHIAGIIHPKLRTKDFFVINHLTTLALVKKAIAVGLKKVIVISSNSPMGYNESPNDVFDEQSSYSPYMGYGKSKMLMEKDLLALAKNSTTDISIIRAPWFYGPDQPIRQTEFFRMIKNGVFPIIGNGKNKRSMGYVDNLSAGIMLLAQKERTNGAVYWLADEEPYSMETIINTVKTSLSEDFGIKVVDRQIKVPGQISDVARLADFMLQGIGLYHQKIHVLSEMNLTIACSIKKAQQDLNYAPKIALRDGMRRSIEWCLSQNIEI